MKMSDEGIFYRGDYVVKVFENKDGSYRWELWQSGSSNIENEGSATGADDAASQIGANMVESLAYDINEAWCDKNT